MRVASTHNPNRPYVVIDGNRQHMPSLERLQGVVQRWRVEAIIGPLGMNQLGKALSLAIKVHGEEKRTSGEPYIEHVVRVMEIIVETGCIVNWDRLIIALLHDVHEAGYPIDAIAKEFWIDIAEKVGQLSKRRLESYMTVKEREDFLLTPSKDELRRRRANEYFGQLADPMFDKTLLIVKVADRIDNLETLNARSIEQIERIIWETETYFLTSKILLRIPMQLSARLSKAHQNACKLLEKKRDDAHQNRSTLPKALA